MSHPSLQATVLAATLSLALSQAHAVTVVATQDSFITQHSAPLFGGSGSENIPQQGQNPDILYFVPDQRDGFETYPLLDFDLGSFSGTTVTQDGTLTLQLIGVTDNPPSGITQLGVHEVLIPWSAATVTWNNFGATAGLQLGTDVETTPTDFQNVDTTLPATSVAPREITFTIPAALIQSWIDNPGANNGLLLYGALGRDLVFGSAENTTPALRPTLTFVPEPATALLLGGGLLGLLRRRR